ncbi:tetratricopeptide repeat protein [Terrarubrum flagellatum]|uniref:tetratricopeptide repeat protein n=1 Tax=Terrirubrum flagellatum TaxID=2895980 RepID=UPI00314521BE
MTRWLLTSIVALAASAALAQTPQPAPGAPPAAPKTETAKPDAGKAPPDTRSVDALFERLQKAEDEDEAKGIANLIERRWLRSNSDVADLLMTRAMTAMQPREQDLPQAIELLDRVIGLEPQWAEAYNKRATAFFMLGDYERSMLDVRQTLSREPRHYGALAGLGQILLSNGDKKHALEAFRKALSLNPRMPMVKGVIDKLAPDVDGRDT